VTWLRNLSLGKKFSLLVGLQVLVLLVGGLLVWIRFEQVQGVLAMVRAASRQAQLTASLANSMNSLRTSHVELIAAAHNEAYEQKRGQVNVGMSAKVAKDLQAVRGEGSWTPECRRLMEGTTGVLDGYLGKFPGVLEQAKAGSVDGDPALMEANVGEARAAREGLERLQALVQDEVDGQTKRAAQHRGGGADCARGAQPGGRECGPSAFGHGGHGRRGPDGGGPGGYHR